MKADWAIVQYLLGEILKTNEKQLDGIYNLPSGASFYVPFQAWKMDTETRQAMATETGKLDASQFNGGVEVFGVYIDRFGNFIQNLANNLTPAQKKEVNTTASEIKFGAKYKDWSGAGGATNGIGTVAPYKPMPAGSPFQYTYQPTPLLPGAGAGAFTGSEPKVGTQYDVPTLNTTFTLNLDNHMTITLDGRVVADALKPYFQSDMLSSEGATGSATSMTVV
jgi:hypothetical protein